MAGVPAGAAGPDRDAEHAARAASTSSTRPSAAFVNVDYNHSFKRRRLAHAQGRRRRTSTRPTTSTTRIPAGTCYLFWDRSFSSSVTGMTGPRHVRLLRGQRSRHAAARPAPTSSSLYVQDQWTSATALTLEPRRAHRERDDPVVPDRHRGVRDRVRLRRQDRAAPRRELRRARRRPGQGVRQLGPLLRLDEVRAGARLVRRRHLAGLLPRARHARRRQPEPDQHAGTRISGIRGARRASAIAACRTSTRSTRTSSRCTRTARASASSIQLGRDSVFGVHYVHNKLTPDDRRHRRRSTSTATRSTHRATPARASRRRCQCPGRRRPFATPKPKRQYDAHRVHVNRRFANNWFGSAQLRLQPPLRQLRRARELGRDPARRRRASPRRPRSSRRAASRGRAATPTARGTSTSCCGTRTATSTSLGRLATDRPHVVKLYGALHAAVRHAGRRLLLRRQRHADQHLREHDQPDAGVRRTAAATWAARPMLTRTDLLRVARVRDGRQPASSGSS